MEISGLGPYETLELGPFWVVQWRAGTQNGPKLLGPYEALDVRAILGSMT